MVLQAMPRACREFPFELVCLPLDAGWGELAPARRRVSAVLAGV